MKRSAGILLFRRGPDGLEVLLGHMGGPFWARKDEHAWSIFKGEYAEDEEALDCARREFAEETGLPVPPGDLIPLGEVKQSGAKRVTAWALEGDLNPVSIVSNTFTIEWPPRSGTRAEFPEIDRAEWFTLDAARAKIVKGQMAFLEALAAL